MPRNLFFVYHANVLAVITVDRRPWIDNTLSIAVHSDISHKNRIGATFINIDLLYSNTGCLKVEIREPTLMEKKICHSTIPALIAGERKRSYTKKKNKKFDRKI